MCSISTLGAAAAADRVGGPVGRTGRADWADRATGAVWWESISPDFPPTVTDYAMDYVIQPETVT